MTEPGLEKASKIFLIVAEPVADFLFRLGANPHLGRFAVQYAGRSLDQEIVVAVDIDRIAKLAHQHTVRCARL